MTIKFKAKFLSEKNILCFNNVRQSYFSDLQNHFTNCKTF